MKRTLAVLLSLIMIISLSACADGTKPDTPLASGGSVQNNKEADGSIVDSAPLAVRMLASALTEKGYKFADIYTQEIDVDRFIHTVSDYYIIELESGEKVYVTVFENAAKAAEHAACYNEDGSHYNSPDISMIIDYIAPVKMWLHEECVIEYGSFDGELYLPLCELFGAPFVGKTSVTEIIETSDIQYIRTNQISGELVNDLAIMIESTEELMQYYEANKEMFDLERREVIYSDTSIGFLDAVDLYYTDEWFEAHNLALVVLSEGSGSIRHRITSVTVRNHDLESFNKEDFSLQIDVQRFIPSLCTDDMAEWHIMIGIPKREYPEAMSVGINETWDTDYGWMIEETSDKVFRAPPELNVQYVGGTVAADKFTYSWENYEKWNDSRTAVNACGVGPLDYEELVSFETDRNIVALQFEEEPDSFTVTCYPLSDRGTYGLNGEKLDVSGTEFILKDGEYIYDISARWERENYSGNANYGFMAKVK